MFAWLGRKKTDRAAELAADLDDKMSESLSMLFWRRESQRLSEIVDVYQRALNEIGHLPPRSRRARDIAKQALTTAALKRDEALRLMDGAS